MRNDGASISELTGMYLGPTMKTVMRIFSVVLLVMIGVVFMVGPAQLLSRMIMGAGRDFNLPRTAAVSIQACYVTRQSVDKMPSVAKAKKAIRKAFENCQLKKGTSVVEFVSTCNSKKMSAPSWTGLYQEMTLMLVLVRRGKNKFSSNYCGSYLYVVYKRKSNDYGLLETTF